MPNINRYARHPPKMTWMESFYQQKEGFFTHIPLGINQYGVFCRFLTDAGFLDKSKNITAEGKLMLKLPFESLSFWGVILVNLSHEAQVGWYTATVPFERIFTKEEALLNLQQVEKQGEKGSNDAWRMFFNLLELPLSNIGLGRFITEEEFTQSTQKGSAFICGAVWRKVCTDVHPLLVLYALFKGKCSRLRPHDIAQLALKGTSPQKLWGLNILQIWQKLEEVSIFYPELGTVHYADSSDQGMHVVEFCFNEQMTESDLLSTLVKAEMKRLRKCGEFVPTSTFPQLLPTQELCKTPCFQGIHFQRLCMLRGALALRYVEEVVSVQEFASRDAFYRQQKPAMDLGPQALLIVVAQAQDEQSFWHSTLMKLYEQNKLATLPYLLVDATDILFNERDRYFTCLSSGQQQQAQQALSTWIYYLRHSDLHVYSSLYPSGHLVSTMGKLHECLREHVRHRYPLNFDEEFQCSYVLYNACFLQKGVLNGLQHKTDLMYHLPEDALFHYVQDLLETSHWKQHPKHRLVQLATFVSDFFKQQKESDGVLREDALKNLVKAVQHAPFGLLPCNISSFLLGFTLDPWKGREVHSETGAILILDEDLIVQTLSSCFLMDYQDLYE